MHTSVRTWLLLLTIGCTLFGHAQTPPKREFRGVWVATVTNIDWPPSPGTPAPSAQAALLRILDNAVAWGFNAVVFQIRPECDAMYQSSIEPWSYYLTGVQGGNPGYDPLAFAVTEAHRRGLELHAWFNPYRAVRDTTSYQVSPQHVTILHPDWILVSGKLKMLNPGMAVVRDYVVRVILDVVRRYDVDAVHMDDYFYTDNYPYLADAATFAQEPRGFTDQGNWRRDNVNTLIHMINDSVHAAKPWVKFGMSPRGIWRPNNPPGISGSDNYNAIWCDALAWLQGQYIDYLAPQLYWKFGGGQDFGLLEPWWAARKNGRHLYPGLADYRIGQTSYGGAGEVTHQVRFCRDQQNAEGTIQYTYNSISGNTGGIADTLDRTLFLFPALAPRMQWKDTVPPYPVRGIANARYGTGFALQWQAPLVQEGQDTAVRYAVYRFDHYPADRAEYSDSRNLLAVTGQRVYAPPVAPIAGSYFFSVASLDRNWNEGDTSNIIRIVPPEPPLALAPASGTIAPDSVTLIWRGVPSAMYYDVWICTDSTFAGGLVFRDSVLTDTSRMVRGLQGQIRYFWRVRAGNAAGWGPFEGGGKFMAGTPATPTLLSPPDASPDIPIVTQLQWNPAASAATYRLQLAAAADFSIIVVDSAGISLPQAVSPTLQNYKIYFWRVRGVNAFGAGAWSAPFRFRTVQATGIDDRDGLPKEFRLDQNYPNPFNPSTTIGFALPAARHVTLTVYDMLGREIARLVDETLPAGLHSAVWNASHCSSGIYLYRLVAGDYHAVGRMVLVK